MAIYDFKNTYTITGVPVAGSTPLHGVVEQNPIIDTHPPGMSQESDIQGVTPVGWEEGRVDVQDVIYSLQPGFRYLDQAMKAYFSDIRVPTKDSYRFVRTIVAGADKSVQIWKDELAHGRVELPVMSINRGNHSFNSAKFSPPYLSENLIFSNRQKTRVREQFRPVPFIVDYTLHLWAEHKRDIENIAYQILIRFNTLAEFTACDNKVMGNVQMKLGGMSDASDKDAGADQLAKTRYDISVSAEAWLSLPERISPTVIGKIGVLREDLRIFEPDVFTERFGQLNC